VPRAHHLSFDLLQTFVRLLDNDGDALKTARQLNINQPSISKRIRYLQLPGPVLPCPWLSREGKRWRATAEGAKALPAVRDLIDRYDQLTAFAGAPATQAAELKLACGQQTVVGFVREALRRFHRSHPHARLRVSTLRGAARIEGVANGLLDLASVTHDEAAIREIARRELHVETIARRRLALVCHARSQWAKDLARFPENKTPPAALATFPLILPEPDAGVRAKLDEVLHRNDLTRKLQVRLEIGGWSAIMAYVEQRFGVGLVSESALPERKALVVRYLDPGEFPPSEVRLICRRRFDDASLPDLSPEGQALYDALKEAAAR